MNRDFFTPMLVAILIVCSLLSTLFAYQHVQLTRDFSRLQAQMNVLQRNQTLVQALSKEAIEYSKQNPTIDPILQQFGLKPKPTQAPTAKAAAK
jgi:hypothetical protein